MATEIQGWFRRRAVVCWLAVVLAAACGGGAEPADNPTPDGASQDLSSPPDTASVDSATTPDTTLPTDVGGAVDAGEEPCVTDSDFFAAELWPTTLKPKCFGCHSGSGIANTTKLVFRDETRTGFLAHNREVLGTVAAYEVGGVSVVLQKPLGELGHGGGAVLKSDDTSHTLLKEFVERLANPVPDDACEKEKPSADEGVFAGVTLLDAAATFRKAALSLAGRVPTSGETAYLRAAGDAGLKTMIGDLLETELFIERVAEHWNDRLLTERYNRGVDALFRLSSKEFPHRTWYNYDEDQAKKAKIPADLMAGAAAKSNTGVAQAPLKLIEHVVRNNKPFSEILTADYMMVTPYSAISYGVFDQLSFVDMLDPTEWRTVKLPKRPHVGVLTSPMFLNRFPTTATNRNRHRSRVVWDLFLATDVMALAERPIDPTEIVEHNPTMFNPDCSVCHTVIDPLAGLFQNWGAEGQYAPPDKGWFSDMLPPGFEGVKLPAGAQQEPLRWMAERIVKDPRFVSAVVRQAYEMVVGVPVVRLPSEEDNSLTAVEKAARLALYKEQQADLILYGAAFKASGLDYKVLVRQLVLSRWFRAAGVSQFEVKDPTKAALRAATIQLLPGSQLLTPEGLNRKLHATLAAPWLRYDKIPYLTHRDEFRIFYGGIDSNSVVRRIRDPNGLMAAVQTRMANEAACIAVPFDFTKPAHKRALFPFIEMNFTPTDTFGNPVPTALTAIRETIRRLGWRFLGHSWKDGDPAFEELVDFWIATQQDGAAAIAKGESISGINWWHCRATKDPNTGVSIPTSQHIGSDPHYTFRAWLALVTVMLSDAEFLYSP